MPACDLHYHWASVRKGLETVAEHGDGWLPEDVYMALKHNSATLHLCTDETGAYLGFVVLTLTAGWQGPEMLIWAGYSAVKEVHPLATWIDQIKDIAKQAGAKRLSMRSPRKGWERIAESIGLAPQQVIYSTEI